MADLWPIKLEGK